MRCFSDSRPRIATDVKSARGRAECLKHPCFGALYCEPPGLLQESLRPFGPDVSQSVPESVPRKRGVSKGVSDGVSPGPFGPRRHTAGHSLGQPPFSGTLSGTLWESGARRARETPCSRPGVRKHPSAHRLLLLRKRSECHRVLYLVCSPQKG